MHHRGTYKALLLAAALLLTAIHGLRAESVEETLAKAEADAERASETMKDAEAALARAEADFATAGEAETKARASADAADAALTEAEAARADVQSREVDARASRSSAEGEANALRAEVAALAKLVERDTKEGGQVLDLLRVQGGYEKALGAALADDLRAPQVDAAGRSGGNWEPELTSAL